MVRARNTASAKSAERDRNREAAPKRRGRGFAEHQREALLRRLSYLGESKKKQPGYKTALRLLNKRYVLSNAKARLNIMKAASFMVFVLEQTPL